MIRHKIHSGFSQIRSQTEKSLYMKRWLAAQTLTLPSFLGIGFPKSGTTWLYENLRTHPKVFVSDKKELRYFDQHFTHPLRSYAQHFSHSSSPVQGEISPSYITLSESRIRFIRSVMPDVKLVVLLRNPIEREWSLLVHACTKAGISVHDQSDDEIIARLQRSRVYQLGGYDMVLERWLSIFDPAQLYIGLYDDLQCQPQVLLEQVLWHIGVRDDASWVSPLQHEVVVPPVAPKHRDRDPGRGVLDAVHQNSSTFLPERIREVLTRMYLDDIEALGRNFGAPTYSWLMPVPEYCA